MSRLTILAVTAISYLSLAEETINKWSLRAATKDLGPGSPLSFVEVTSSSNGLTVQVTPSGEQSSLCSFNNGEAGLDLPPLSYSDLTCDGWLFQGMQLQEPASVNVSKGGGTVTVIELSDYDYAHYTGRPLDSSSASDIIDSYFAAAFKPN